MFECVSLVKVLRSKPNQRLDFKSELRFRGCTTECLNTKKGLGLGPNSGFEMKH